ncbi:hypothetical protein [Nocardia sp. CY41]|uniref:hypothetical protein n=1 Tax=Nocardia sp. CY41 TaxID=2608686 RepID=UPI00135BC496|nr:hypothetical protein [Nocardia sp. CY41]
MTHAPDHPEPVSMHPMPGPRPGSIVMLFQLDPDTGSPSGIHAHHAILAALRQAGLLPAADSHQDARDLAEYHDRGMRLEKPQVWRYGRTAGWQPA